MQHSALIDFDSGFLDEDEAALTRDFIDLGYLVRPAEDRTALDSLRGLVVDAVCRELGLDRPRDPGLFLDTIHTRLTVDDLNRVRMSAINRLAGDADARHWYFALAKHALEVLVGNEMAMQRRLNLSVQMPEDDSSLLHVHADVWDGDSPFEVVLWVPLVDCRATKSMYILPRAAHAAHEADFSRFRKSSADDLFTAIQADVAWLTVDYGQVLLFSQNLMHGNVVNRTGETRWSMNARFKSLFSPYAGKRLGEFFEPITIRAATRFGMTYRFPEGLDE